MSRRYDYSYNEKGPTRMHWTDIPTGLFFAVALLAIGLALAINLRPLYYHDIDRFDLVAESGLNAVVIKENYNALIDYCSPFYTGDLVFPSLRASQSGLSHFAECKNIFNVIYIAGAVCLVLTVLIFFIKRRNGEYLFLRTSAIITLVLPVLAGLAVAINFDAFFLLFHKLAFNNDDWLFDPETDPIINLLPEEFFLQCAVIIVATMILGALIALVAFFISKRKHKVERLLPVKKNYMY